MSEIILGVLCLVIILVTVLVWSVIVAAIRADRVTGDKWRE